MANVAAKRFTNYHDSNPAVLNRIYEGLTSVQRDEFDAACEACAEAGIRRSLLALLTEVQS